MAPIRQKISSTCLHLQAVAPSECVTGEWAYLYVEVDFSTSAQVGEVPSCFQVSSSCIRIQFVHLLLCFQWQSTLIEHLHTRTREDMTEVTAAEIHMNGSWQSKDGSALTSIMVTTTSLILCGSTYEFWQLSVSRDANSLWFRLSNCSTNTHRGQRSTSDQKTLHSAMGCLYLS